MTDNDIVARDADEDPNIERLVRRDREILKSFLECLSRGVKIDDMSDDLKSWWATRY
jgi:hypothetical protein